MSEHPDAHDETALGKAYDARLMGRLLAYVRPYRGMAAGAVALIIASSLLQLAGPLITAVALDLFIRPGGAEEETTLSTAGRGLEGFLAGRGIELAPAEGLALLAALYVAVLVATFVVLYWQGYVMNLMGQYIMFDLRSQIFARLQRLPVRFFDRNPIGRLVTRVTNDVDALNELFTSGVVAIFGDVALLTGIVAVLFWLNWRLALLTFAILPLLLLLTLWFKLRARESYREVRVKLARINAFLQEHLSGMGVVQLFNRERAEAERFAQINREHRDANVRAIFYYGVYYPAVELITALGVGLILWYGGARVVSGALSIGALVAFLQYAQRFYQPLADLSEKYNILQAAMASSERIFHLLEEPLEVVSPSSAYRPGGSPGGSPEGRPEPGAGEGAGGGRSGVRGAIEFSGVHFAYKDDETVLRDLSFRVEPGETVAVVGHTGAGKTTLASLLLRFYDVTQGAVKVDGVDVREWDLAALRSSIAMVLQDVFLFSGTVAHNIRLGQPGIDDERLRRAAREVHAAPFIERLPGGYEALVRERGAGLSVGQKQLIAFARALAFDPRILILDEATASVDTETEQAIQRALDRLLADRTSLVIAHRLSTIQRASRILVLHNGELREQGTHQELLTRRGIYYKLYQLQYKDQAAA